LTAIWVIINLYQVPTLDTWAEAASVAYKVFLGDEAVPKQRQLITFFNNAFNAPIRFSEARCKKVLPLAFAAYQEGLPTHYTKAYHEGRVGNIMDKCLKYLTSVVLKIAKLI
jgi:Smg8_Smg9